MATILTDEQGRPVVQLDSVEAHTLNLHAARNGLILSDALADLIERGLACVAMEMEQEESESRNKHTEDSLTIMLHIMYPKEGPLSVFDGTEKGLVASLLLDTLDVAMHSIRHTRNMMEKLHVVEREDEGVGTGKPSIPVNRRGESDLRRSVGPDSDGGQV